jgi:hypothetical protein
VLCNCNPSRRDITYNAPVVVHFDYISAYTCPRTTASALTLTMKPRTKPSIVTFPSTIIALRSYGEGELDLRVPSLTEAEMCRIQDIAKRHSRMLGVPLTPTGPSDRLTQRLSKADSLAAVEVVEGATRPLKRKRRTLRGIFAV